MLSLTKVISTIIIVYFISVLVTSCTQQPQNPDEEFLQSSTLRVVTRNGPTTRYRHPKGQWMGPETEMITAFSQYLGREIEFQTVNTTQEIIEGFQRDQWHIAAAGLTITNKRKQFLNFSPSYQKIRQQLVCYKSLSIKKVSELKDKTLLISSGTSYEENLIHLKKNKYPWLKWQSSTELSTEEILSRVSQRKVDCTIADSNIIIINQRFFPELKVQRPMSSTQELSWALSPKTPSLNRKVSQWFSLKSTKKLIKNILDKYYAHAPLSNTQYTQQLHQKIKDELSQRKFSFQKISQKTALPWIFIASLDYAETQWSSPTSQRDPLGITSRTTLGTSIQKESLEEHIQLLKIQMNRLPKEFGADLIWVALAAYKIGLAHVEDAIYLAKKSPHFSYNWISVREALSKLVNSRFNKNLKNGYAQGTHAVKFVDDIKNYSEILNQYKAKTQPDAH